MSAAARGRGTSLVLLAALLGGACALARAQESPPVPGGTVPSTLELSLGEPSDFKRTGSTPEGTVYTATLRAEVSATDAPTQLSVSDGDASFTQPLRAWSEPVARGAARVRLRTVASSPRALRGQHKLFLVTLTAGGP